jgi:hypothetical protein
LNWRGLPFILLDPDIDKELELDSELNYELNCELDSEFDSELELPETDGSSSPAPYDKVKTSDEVCRPPAKATNTSSGCIGKFPSLPFSLIPLIVDGSPRKLFPTMPAP